MVRIGTALAAAAVVLSACAFDDLAASFSVEREIDMASSMQGPTGFTEALRSEYTDRAQIEEAEGDFANAKYFARRAQAAGGGEVVEPELVENRTLPAGTAGELTSARAGLVSALNAGGRERAPQAAARAQRVFDCWLEEQEENIQPADIAACRDAFRTALGEVQQALLPEPLPPQQAPPAPMAAPAARDYLVFFDFDLSDIRADSAQILDQVAVAFGELNASSISLTGFTDLAGPNAYNQALSERRTISARDYLVGRGIPQAAIRGAGRGENDPRVPSADGVREQENRRVEIQIN